MKSSIEKIEPPMQVPYEYPILVHSKGLDLLILAECAKQGTVLVAGYKSTYSVGQRWLWSEVATWDNSRESWERVDKPITVKFF